MKKILPYIGSHIIFNLLLLSGCAGLTTYLFISGRSSLGGPMLILTLFCIYRIYRIMIRNNEKVTLMLDAMENHDHTLRFNENPIQHSDKNINIAINRITQNLKKAHDNTVQQDKYYELILNCLHSGVVVVDDNGYVFQKNNEALRLLGLSVFAHIKQLKKIDSSCFDKFSRANSGDRFRVSYSNEREVINLAVSVSDIHFQEKHLRIFALNNIHSELDSQEIESWSKLTRVLTHEIMNSVAPVSSLSETLLNFAPKESEELRQGLETIHSTSKTLMEFVQSYRQYTNIPQPNPGLIDLQEFINRMVNLARYQYPCPDIRFTIQLSPADLILYADENLISQVVINILKNAIQAMGNQAGGEIKITVSIDEAETISLIISNNGPVIPDEVAENIFVPFFTTKSDGSGIGLSISRHIMKLSGGNLALKTDKENQITSFILTFN